jgi:thiamine-phosphate pyrophosphorylase
MAGSEDLRRTLRVVAITDRRLMVPAGVLGGGDWPAIAAAFGAAVARAVDGCPAGSVIVQVREKDLDGGPLLQLVRAAQPFAAVVVNDRLDVALAAGAHGVHLPERGLSVDDARAIIAAAGPATSARAAVIDPDAATAAPVTAGTAAASSGAVRDRPPLLVGVSRHAPPGETGADLVHLGSIWPTPAKQGVAPLGEAALAWPHGRALLVAVGGIDSPARAAGAVAAGAAAVAVIRAAWTGASLAPFVAAVDAARAGR